MPSTPASHSSTHVEAPDPPKKSPQRCWEPRERLSPSRHQPLLIPRQQRALCAARRQPERCQEGAALITANYCCRPDTARQHPSHPRPSCTRPRGPVTPLCSPPLGSYFVGSGSALLVPHIHLQRSPSLWMDGRTDRQTGHQQRAPQHREGWEHPCPKPQGRRCPLGATSPPLPLLSPAPRVPPEQRSTGAKAKNAHALLLAPVYLQSLFFF